MKKNLLLILFTFVIFFSYSQTTNISGVINTYYPVLNINTVTCSPTFTIDTSYSSNILVENDLVLIIQMKGAEISQLDDITYGDVLNINNAGKYEFGKVKNAEGNTVSLCATLLNTYDIGSIDGYIQLIKVPQYINANITSTLTASPWNNTTKTGGVLALDCSGKLTLNANINVSGLGFQGGIPQDGLDAPDGFWPPPITSPRMLYVTNTPNFGGAKGEGITNLNHNLNYGRGKNANGGGGGNWVNSGGGGGSNTSTGGKGGDDAANASAFMNGGIGGLSLNSYKLSRIFLGGGGGAGQSNNNGAGSGGNGGGIVIIQCDKLIGNNHFIYADGNLGIDSPTPIGLVDGAGGGGAGGTVLISSNEVLSNFTVSIKGGKGGNNNCNAGQYFASAGGGSGGRLITKSNFGIPTPNIIKSGGIAGVLVNNGMINNGSLSGDSGIIELIDTIPQSSISCCLSALNDINNIHTLQIYPNPVYDILSFNTNQLGNLNIKIYDFIGKVVSQINLSSLNNNLNVNISNLEKGQYILEITYPNNEQQVARFNKY